jgi:hypothetical protein
VERRDAQHVEVVRADDARLHLLQLLAAEHEEAHGVVLGEGREGLRLERRSVNS